MKTMTREVVTRLFLLLLVLSMALIPRPAFAKHGDDSDEVSDNGHKDKHHKHDKDRDQDDDDEGYGPYFTRQRVVIIRDYYTAEQLAGLPPGIRKHLERTGHLPPGLEKKFVVNSTLPTEYVNDFVPAPPELVTQFGPLPPDSRLYFYNGDAILLNQKTQAVLEIMHGALTLTGH